MARFLFSITLNKKYRLIKNHGYAIFDIATYGPTFGGGHDLHISNECNMNLGSYCADNASNSYEVEPYYDLAGGHHFKVIDYEVYRYHGII